MHLIGLDLQKSLIVVFPVEMISEFLLKKTHQKVDLIKQLSTSKSPNPPLWEILVSVYSSITVNFGLLRGVASKPRFPMLWMALKHSHLCWNLLSILTTITLIWHLISSELISFWSDRGVQALDRPNQMSRKIRSLLDPCGDANLHVLCPHKTYQCP